MGTTRQDEQQHLFGWPNDIGFQTLDEQRTPIELRVKGRFPAATAGTLLRTGPSSYLAGKATVAHWFDGFSQVYRFRIEPQDGGHGATKVFFNSRRQMDGALERARATGKLEGFSFAQKRDPCTSFFGKLMTVFTASREKLGEADRENIAVTIHPPIGSGAEHGASAAAPNGELECRTDAAIHKTIDAATLEPTGVSSQAALHPALAGELSGAHAAFDPVTGDAFNYNLQFGRRATYRVFRTDAASGETDILATISGPDIAPAYVHSIFLTENFVVLCVWTAHIRNGGLRVLWERNVLDAIAPFDAGAQAHWLVVDRKHGRGVVHRFVSPAMFCFHTVNAWEEKTAANDAKDEVDIVAEVVTFPSLDVLHRFYYENIVSTRASEETAAQVAARTPSLSRFRLSGVSADATWDSKARSPQPLPSAVRELHIPGPTVGELPTINPLHATKPHRYVYSVADRGQSSFVDALVKTDTDAQTARFWSCDRHTPGEAIFVADPARKDREDGGWLLSVVLDGDKGASYLLCLDAETMREVARAETDDVCGFGFHGTHLAKV